ncbi:hypothetical protein B0H13DRAFT_2058639 [Mycena leptocephala]|nr:hypothetical protein B0H13DRAFT_2058639 [Mycena leptocephala]
MRLAILSMSTHDLLGYLPDSLWTIPSLAMHLQKCKKAEAPKVDQDSKETAHVGQGEGEDNFDKEENFDDTLPSIKPLTEAPNVCVIFHRAIDSICAWTTGPRVLLHSRLNRADIPINVSVFVVDLPRNPIDAITTKLVAHWTRNGRWSFEVSTKVLTMVKKTPPGVTEGALHCEAGLMASILLHNKNLKPMSGEPAPLTAAFQGMLADGMDDQKKLAIGVAKKCCQVCGMLSELIKTTYGLELELPGRHGSYRPWVPPAWLPESLLKTLETALLTKVEQMVVAKDSRASSAANDLQDPLAGESGSLYVSYRPKEL